MSSPVPLSHGHGGRHGGDGPFVVGAGEVLHTRPVIPTLSLATCRGGDLN